MWSSTCIEWIISHVSFIWEVFSSTFMEQSLRSKQVSLKWCRYLIKIIFFIKNCSFRNLFVSIKQFTNEAFDFIIKNCSNVENIDELRKHPDTLDDFFRLSLRFLQRCPLEFIESPIFTPIMTLAVTSLNIDHRDANLSITKFLSEFVAYSHKPQIKVSVLVMYTSH